MKIRKIDCPNCKAKKTIEFSQKLTESGVVLTISKCAECEVIPTITDFFPKLNDNNKQSDYYLD